MTSPALDRLAWWCRLTLRALAAGFALVGATFLLRPDATIDALNAAGAAFGEFAPAPPSALRFWLSLATGYMVLVTALAAVAARDLRRHRTLVALLALGKATSSVTCLGFYLRTSPAFVYLANFAVDGTIALVAAAIWALVPRLDVRAAAGRPGAAADPARSAGGTRAKGDSPPSAGGARALAPTAFAALLEAMLPPAGSFPEGAADVGVAPAVVRYVGAAGPAPAATFRLLVGAVELSPFFLRHSRRRRFSRLPLAERVAVLDAWECSRLGPCRQAMHALKTMVMLHAYSHPTIEARLGYPHPLVRVPRDAP